MVKNSKIYLISIIYANIQNHLLYHDFVAPCAPFVHKKFHQNQRLHCEAKKTRTEDNALNVICWMQHMSGVFEPQCLYRVHVSLVCSFTADSVKFCNCSVLWSCVLCYQKAASCLIHIESVCLDIFLKLRTQNHNNNTNSRNGQQ